MNVKLDGPDARDEGVATLGPRMARWFNGSFETAETSLGVSVKTSGGVGVMGLAISRLLLARDKEAARQAVISSGLAIALAYVALNPDLRLNNERWRQVLRIAYLSGLTYQGYDAIVNPIYGPGFGEGYYSLMSTHIGNRMRRDGNV